MPNLALAQRLVYSTVKINCTRVNGNPSTGTGFFFTNVHNESLVITNWHVVKDAVNGQFVMIEGDKYNDPIPGAGISIKMDKFSERWEHHSDPNVDLCAMPLLHVIRECRKDGKVPYPTTIDYTTIPSDEEWQKFIPAEDILMIGYPNGIWDDVNLLPYFKKGMTATHPSINYKGEDEFVMDISVYPGSSGSPVFLLTDDFYKKSRSFEGGNDRARLLGVAYKHFKYNNDGSIVSTILEWDQTDRIPPIDLGIAIRSTKLRGFDRISNLI